MKQLLLPAVLGVIALQAHAAPASDLAACRSLQDAARRLACYDTLADAAAVAPAVPAAAVRPAPPAPSAVAAKATPPAGDAVFGLPESRRPDAVESVDSALPATFSGWGPNSRIRLANGQVWQVIDGSSVVLPEGPRKVSVKRGVLSSFYLDIDGLKTSPRVRRVE